MLKLFVIIIIIITLRAWADAGLSAVGLQVTLVINLAVGCW